MGFYRQCYTIIIIPLFYYTHTHTHTKYQHKTDSPDEATLLQVLNFITGCSSIPPLGFKDRLCVKFHFLHLTLAFLKLMHVSTSFEFHPSCRPNKTYLTCLISLSSTVLDTLAECDCIKMYMKSVDIHY